MERTVRRDSFLGRAAELTAIDRALAGSRVVTLVGPGGVGKTRTTLEYVDSQTRWTRVWVVTLAERDDSVADVVAAQMNAPGEAAVDRILMQDDALLVLDNLEHMIDEVATWVTQLLDRVPLVSVLTTSREAMSIRGEQLVELAPLSLDACVDLFIERARERGATVTPDEVTPLVARLGGLPLAIEIAASRTTALRPAQMLSRLDALGLDLLASRDRDRTARHRTLRATVDWSWELLADESRLALAECAAFRGGFDLSAAEAVLSAGSSAWEQLEELVAKSLIRRVDERYELLEPVRMFAVERLEATDHAPVYRRHAQYYAALGWNGRVGECGAIEHPNLFAAHERVRTTDVVLTARLTRAAESALRTRRAMVELRDLAAAALAAAPEPQTDAERWAHAILLRSRAGAHLGCRMLDEATADGRAAARLAEELASDELRADILPLLGAILLEAGGDDAEHCVQQGLEAADRAGFFDLQIDARYYAILTLYVFGRWDDAETAGREAIALAVANDDERGEGRICAALGMVQKHGHAPEVALRSFERAIDISTRLGDTTWIGVSTLNLADLELRCGQYEESLQHYQRGLELAVAIGDRLGESAALIGLGTLASRTGGNPRELLHSAIDAVEGLHAYYERARAYSVLGIWELRDGRHQMAGDLFRRAIDMLTVVADRRWIGLMWAYRACATAMSGADFEPYLDGARAAWSEPDEPHLLGDLDHARAVCVALGNAMQPEPGPAARARIDELNRHTQTGVQWLADNHIETWHSLRVSAARTSPVIELTDDARHVWLPSGVDHDFSRRGPLRLMVLALATAAQTGAGECLSVEDLVGAGYPDEAMTADSGKMRVHTAVRRLRKLGFADILLTRDEGYLLDPALDVRFRA